MKAPQGGARVTVCSTREKKKNHHLRGKSDSKHNPMRKQGAKQKVGLELQKANSNLEHIHWLHHMPWATRRSPGPVLTKQQGLAVLETPRLPSSRPPKSCPPQLLLPTALLLSVYIPLSSFLLILAFLPSFPNPCFLPHFPENVQGEGIPTCTHSYKNFFSYLYPQLLFECHIQNSCFGLLPSSTAKTLPIYTKGGRVGTEPSVGHKPALNE